MIEPVRGCNERANAVPFKTLRSSFQMALGAIHDSHKIRDFFASIAQRYDLTNHLLSLGFDFLWRNRVAQAAAALSPVRVLDIATGTGDLCRALQTKLPGSDIISIDFCLQMLVFARAKGIHKLAAADALHLPFEDGTFDLATVAFGLRNMSSWHGALAEMRRVLEIGGTLLVLDFSLPSGLLRTPYLLYLRHVMPGAAHVITREKTAYEYLSESIEKFPQGSAMEAVLAKAGFGDVRTIPLTLGVASLYTCKKEA